MQKNISSSDNTKIIQSKVVRSSADQVLSPSSNERTKLPKLRDPLIDAAVDEAFAAEAWGHDFWSADPLVDAAAISVRQRERVITSRSGLPACNGNV